MYSLRLAVREDAPAIRRLIWQVHINPTGLDWRRFVLAVDPAGRLLGCGQLKPHRDGTVELASIAVRPGFRQQGIARAVIERLLAGAGRPIYLVCAYPLQGFYERFHFHVIGPAEMPPSYHRQWQFINRLKKLLPKGTAGLLVMKLD